MPEPRKSPAPDLVSRAVELYGDLLFDLCSTVLWSPSTAPVAFRAILKDIARAAKGKERFEKHERAWMIGIACERLRSFANRHGRRLTPAEQIMLDANPDVGWRLQHFDSFFHRLGREDQILLLLHDRYELPYPEIASALGVPEGSLKIRRQQALRSLDEWIWEAEGR